MQRIDQTNFLNACDISLISLAPGMCGLGVPSKAYNIMAAGKPIIAIVEPKSEIGLLVQEEGIGWVVKPGQVDTLVNIIMDAKSDLKRLESMGNRARYVAEKKYCFENIIGSYKSVIEGCL